MSQDRDRCSVLSHHRYHRRGFVTPEKAVAEMSVVMHIFSHEEQEASMEFLCSIARPDCVVKRLTPARWRGSGTD